MQGIPLQEQTTVVYKACQGLVSVFAVHKLKAILGAYSLIHSNNENLDFQTIHLTLQMIFLLFYNFCALPLDLHILDGR